MRSTPAGNNTAIDDLVNEFFKDGQVLEYCNGEREYMTRVKTVKKFSVGGPQEKYVVICEYPNKDILSITVKGTPTTLKGESNALIDIEEQEVHTVTKGRGYLSDGIIRGTISEKERNSNGNDAYNEKKNGNAKEFYIKKISGQNFKYVKF